jgi:hypothetical protein
MHSVYYVLKEEKGINGSLIQIKVCSVARGHQQDEKIYNKVTSPTVSTARISTILIMTVQYDLVVCTGAFLKALMPKQKKLLQRK